MNTDVRVVMRSPRWILLLLTLAWIFATVPPSAAQQEEGGGPESADREWRFIEQLEQDGMADLVLRQLEQFAQNFPRDPRAASALLRAAEGQSELGNVARASQLYALLLERYPSSEPAPKAALHRADLLTAGGQWSEAVGAYRSLLATYPASEQAEAARLGLGEALMSTGKEDEARRLFSGLIGGRAVAEIAARARFDLALLDVRAGADSLAIERFDSVHEQHPGEPVAAFALMRAAELLVDREAPGAARARFEKVLAEYDQPVLRARARLGIASLVEAQDPGLAAEQYQTVVEEGATPEDLGKAFLGLARASLQDGQPDLSQTAASGYLERFGAMAPGASQARLLRARAMIARKHPEGQAALESCVRDADLQVAFEAASLLARSAEGRELSEQAVTWWRQAEAQAPDAERRATALYEQARLALSMGRFALAADLALASENAVVEIDAEAASASALLAARSAERAGDYDAAERIARRLAERYPLTASAPEARARLRLLAHLRGFDAAATAEALAALAARSAEDAVQRELEIGGLLRDGLGDFEAARAHFQRAKKAAGTPAQNAEAEFALAETAAAEALVLGLGGDGEGARRLLRDARSRFASVAAIEGAPEQADRGRERLFGLELADAARPDSPWMFDSASTPLLGAVGVAEGVDLGSTELLRVQDRIRRRLVAVQDGGVGARERTWLVWREAELAQDSVVDRAARVKAELDRSDCEPSLRLALRHCFGQLALLANENAIAARELAEVLNEAGDSELGFAARYGLAQAHRAEKRYVQAGQLYVEFASAYPSSQRGQRALLLAGDCALFSDQSEEAVQRYRQLLERYPDTVYEDDALYRLGTALHRAGKIEAARDALQRLIESSGGSDYRGRALARLAQIEADGGDARRAIAALEELVRVDPERAVEERAWTRLAELHLEEQDSQAALTALQGAAARGELDTDALALRVRALALLDRAEAAKATLDELSVAVVDRVELVTEARLDVAESLARTGKDEAAATLFRDAAAEAADPVSKARAAYGEALIAAKAGRWADARGLFERAAMTGGGDWTAEALFKLGQLYDRDGDFRASQNAYARISEEFPAHAHAPMALRGEARAWRQMGRFDEALGRYHAVLERYPEASGGEEVLSHIAYCHHEMGQYEMAMAAYRRVMPLLDEESQAYAQFWIADSLSQLGRSAEAATEFLRIPYLHPQMGQLAVTAQLKAGEAYESAGDPEAARSLYERVLRVHGEQSQWGAEAKRRMERMESGARGSE